MLLPRFQYHEPENLEEACEILAGFKEEASPLAGGTDLLVNMKKGVVSPMNGRIKKILTACALCYHNCGTEVTVKEGKVAKIEGQKSHLLNKGWLCPRGRATIEYIYHPDRLKYPLRRNGSKWERITWDQALSEIANKLAGLKDACGPSSLGFFCGSVGVENLEMVALTHRLKAAFGSPNFFSVESVCYRMRIRCRQITFGKYPIEELDSNLYIL